MVYYFKKVIELDQSPKAKLKLPLENLGSNILIAIIV
jgi:hypothetical protein